MSEAKKCTPLKCKTFSKIAIRVEDKQPVDRIVVNCPYRKKSNCTNEAETFNKGATY
jgi:hypothetical protein